MKTKRSTLAASAIALIALLALAPGAPGLSDLVVGGQTRLKLERGLYAKLKREGVRIVKLGPGRVSGRTTTLPVTGGQMDPVGASGVLTEKGGLRLIAAGRAVRIEKFGIDTVHKQVSAAIGGKQMQLASIVGFKFGRSGFGNSFEVTRLPLTGKAAGALNKALRLSDVFKPGRSLGSLSGTTAPSSTSVASGTIALVVADGFTAKQASIGVETIGFETTPVSQTPQTWNFPLISGGVNLEMTTGGVGAEAGWRIQGGPPAPQVPVMSLYDVTVDLNGSRLTAQMQIHDATGNPTMVGTVPLGTLSLAAAPRQIDQATRTMTLTNAAAALTQSFADRLNEVFAQPQGKSPLFAAGEPLGTASVSLQTH